MYSSLSSHVCKLVLKLETYLHRNGIEYISSKDLLFWEVQGKLWDHSFSTAEHCLWGCELSVYEDALDFEAKIDLYN